ncbi:MAG: hypothetical protein JO360_01095 [Acidobacteria bacterium]|nr:hypothetical protein [Acidobacteriota bacterium]
MFENISVKEPLPLVVLKKVLLLVAITFLCIGLISAHRAYFQVRSLELDVPAAILHSGSNIRTAVVSSGRTYVDLKLELIQNEHTETIGTQRVPSNEYGFFDPRTQQATLNVTLTPDLLARFQPGPAHLRATASGHPQWTRTPPPVIREQTVEIKAE